MPDKIIIKNLKLPCRVGVPEEERKKPQTVEIDLDLIRDLHEAGKADDVLKTVDYARVVSILEQHLKDKEYKLVERLAEEIADRILQEFELDAVQIQVRKKVLKQAEWTGVEIVRQRKASSRRLGF